jgi:hypothetical protein
VGGSVGRVYLAVRLRRADGSEIDGSATGGTPGGTWWYYPVANQEPPADQWTHYRRQFGNGTNHQFPDDARYATVAFILNYDNGSSGTKIYQVQGLAIHDAVDNKCGGNMASYGSGCISQLQTPATDFYSAQDQCKNNFKGTVCMYHEIQRACAAGAITSTGATNIWMGDHSTNTANTYGTSLSNSDDEYFVTNSDSCFSNIDGLPLNSNQGAYAYRCCR